MESMISLNTTKTKSYFLSFLMVQVFLVTASTPLVTGLEIGEWDYGYNRCETKQWHFDSVGAAESAGMNYYYNFNDGCPAPTVVGDDGFPPEDYPLWESRWGCAVIYHHPKYKYERAYYSSKNLTVEYNRLIDGTCITSTDSLFIFERRKIECPEGYEWGDVPPLNDYQSCVKKHVPEGDECPAEGGANAGAKINTATGNEFHREIIDLFNEFYDFSLYYSASTALQTSGKPSDMVLGKGWNHTYNKQLMGVFKVNGDDSVFVRRNDGKLVLFSKNGIIWENKSHTSEVLKKVNNTWILSSNCIVSQRYC